MNTVEQLRQEYRQIENEAMKTGNMAPSYATWLEQRVLKLEAEKAQWLKTVDKSLMTAILESDKSNPHPESAMYKCGKCGMVGAGIPPVCADEKCPNNPKQP